MKARVTKSSHPTIFEAFETISHDCGARAGHSFYEVPAPWSSRLAEFETALYPLGEDELHTFCIGEQDEMIAIMAEYKLDAACDFLTAFFESDWRRA